MLQCDAKYVMVNIHEIMTTPPPQRQYILVPYFTHAHTYVDIYK